MPDPASEPARFVRVATDGARTEVARPVAEETPVALELNGIGYAVLMATPADLEDLATGFLLAERLIGGVADIEAIEPNEVAGGVLLRVILARAPAEEVTRRVRHRASDSSCGLCGVETLEQALRPLPCLPAGPVADDSALFAALGALDAHQALNRLTGAAHAAAACTAEGGIRLVREDVGRHNAFDKLIGAMLRAGADWEGGFALLTSRCSYELVEKAVLAGCPMLATVSAPTALALRRAHAAGLALRTLVRRDALLRLLP